MGFVTKLNIPMLGNVTLRPIRRGPDLTETQTEFRGSANYFI